MAMELRHEFTVPVGIAEAWEAFDDIESVAECFPGATVSSVEGDSFRGSCKVKLGPIALVYNGTGTFVEKDEAARRMVIDAQGKDKRGNGTAGAHVVATMAEEGTSTRVEVLTDLHVTGKPAQFGRGVMQDVSDKLLGQFTACLEQRLGVDTSAPAAEPADVAATPVSSVPPAGPTDGGAGRPDRGMHNMREIGQHPPRGSDEAIDLGATVLPVLARTYWKQALGLVIVLLVLRRLLRR